LQIADCRLQLAGATVPAPDLHRERQLEHRELQDRWRDKLATIMRAYAGPLRDGDGLTQALQKLNELEQEIGSACSVQRSAFLTARLIVAGALMRRESRGAHFRADYPRAEEAWRGHLVQARGRAARLVERVAEEEGVAV
jgi:L-aspartate oxidase